MTININIRMEVRAAVSALYEGRAGMFGFSSKYYERLPATSPENIQERIEGVVDAILINGSDEEIRASLEIFKEQSEAAAEIYDETLIVAKELLQDPKMVKAYSFLTNGIEDPEMIAQKIAGMMADQVFRGGPTVLITGDPKADQKAFEQGYGKETNKEITQRYINNTKVNLKQFIEDIKSGAIKAKLDEKGKTITDEEVSWDEEKVRACYNPKKLEDLKGSAEEMFTKSHNGHKEVMQKVYSPEPGSTEHFEFLSNLLDQNPDLQQNVELNNAFKLG